LTDKYYGYKFKSSEAIMKVCSKCKIEKDESEFGNKKDCKNGLSPKCKTCKKIEGKSYRTLNKDKVKKINKNYRDNNKIKVKEYHIKRYNEYKNVSKKQPKYKICSKCLNEKKIDRFGKRIDSIDGFQSYCKDCRKNRDEERIINDNNLKTSISKKQKEWREKNHTHLKKYREENKNRFRLLHREWCSKEKNNNPEYKIKCNIMTLFRAHLNCRSIKKTKPFFKYTEIAYADYITYFENNYPLEFAEITVKGKYHIDHIIPCAIYDFNNPEHIKLCWQPENLRIIPAKENLEKNDKLDFDLIKKHNIEHLLPKDKRRLA